MQIVPKPAASLASELNAEASSAAKNAASKARAMAILQGSSNQAAPVADPSSVSVEEVGAITSQVNENSTQNHNSGDSQELKPSAESPTQEASKPKEEPLSAQYAQLARKEKAMRAEALKIKAERDAMKASQAKLEQDYNAKLADAEKAWKSKLLENPLDVMEETGLTYDQLTERMVNNNPEQRARDQYTKKLEARLLELEKKQETTAKSYEDNQKQQYNQAVNQIKSEVTSLVTSDPEFETIKETNSIGDVVELIEKTFNSEGILLSVEEAAKAVEEHLVEEALKISRISKIQKRLQPAKQDSGKPATESPKQQQPKTLTNTMGSTRPLTSKERAIAAFKGQLKH